MNSCPERAWSEPPFDGVSTGGTTGQNYPRKSDRKIGLMSGNWWSLKEGGHGRLPDWPKSSLLSSEAGLRARRGQPENQHQPKLGQKSLALASWCARTGV